MTICASYDVWGLHKARSEWKCKCHLRSHKQNCVLHRDGVVCLSWWVTPCLAMMPVPVAFQSPYGMVCLSWWVTPCLAMMPVPVAFQSPYKDVEYRLVVPNSRFALDPNTGVISVKADLTRDTDSSFTVRILDLFLSSWGNPSPPPSPHHPLPR